jgi:hypothetical protein
MPKLTVRTFGTRGVNVDKNPLDLDDDELQSAQNTISDPTSGTSSLRKRPGLLGFNTATLTYTVLGGSPLPGPNLTASGTVTIYLGRSPVV